MGTIGKVAVLGDGRLSQEVARTLIGRGYEVLIHDEPRLALEGKLDADLVVTCLPAKMLELSAVLERLACHTPGCPLVAVGSADALAREPSLTRVFDTVVDPIESPHRLLSAVGYALGTRQEDRELGHLRDRSAAEARSLIGESEAMRTILGFVDRLARRTASGAAPTVLLLGETGTGKGLMAQAIHQAGVRRSRPFVQVNCAAIPDNLVESEFFGFERGAFTDANRAKAGLFETADGGSLFLDEIGCFPLQLQAKLLTTLEDKLVRRIGAHQPRPVDVQVIAAAQPRLREQVRTGAFRPDLFHRLNIASITLPPLRDRADDRVLLAERFVAEFCRGYGLPPKRLAKDAVAFIRRYHWPGNVRELRNQIERIILLHDEPEIRAWQFERASGEILRVDVENQLRMRIQLPDRQISLTEVEKQVISSALEKHDGNVSATARYLGLTRQTLIYRLRKHGIQA